MTSTPDGGGSGEAPLFGPNGRIPTARAVTLTRQSGFATLRSGWLPRHTLAMSVLSPLLFGVYSASGGTGLVDPFLGLLIGGMSVVGALILTTYLPLRGGRRAPASSCAVMAGLLVPGAAIILHQTPGAFTAALALGALSLGLYQRVAGTSAC